MPANPDNTVLRLRKRHAPSGRPPPDAADGRRLVDAQSPLNAVFAGLIAVIAFAVLWALLSVSSGRVFPWLTLLLGFFTGFAVRRAGSGLDWRFPAIGGVCAFAGSVIGNVVVAAAYTARELGSTTITVLKGTTEYTWPVFFDEVMTSADIIYALCAAAIAAFFANRRLSRRQFHALRLYEEQRRNG